MTDIEAAAIGIIGGADGHTAVMVAVPTFERERHTAVLSLHFDLVDRVEWKLVFYVKKMDDLTIELM